MPFYALKIRYEISIKSTFKNIKYCLKIVKFKINNFAKSVQKLSFTDSENLEVY